MEGTIVSEDWNQRFSLRDLVNKMKEWVSENKIKAGRERKEGREGEFTCANIPSFTDRWVSASLSLTPSYVYYLAFMLPRIFFQSSFVKKKEKGAKEALFGLKTKRSVEGMFTICFTGMDAARRVNVWETTKTVGRFRKQRKAGERGRSREKGQKIVWLGFMRYRLCLLTQNTTKKKGYPPASSISSSTFVSA